MLDARSRPDLEADPTAEIARLARGARVPEAVVAAYRHAAGSYLSAWVYVEESPSRLSLTIGGKGRTQRSL